MSAVAARGTVEMLGAPERVKVSTDVPSQPLSATGSVLGDPMIRYRTGLRNLMHRLRQTSGSRRNGVSSRHSSGAVAQDLIDVRAADHPTDDGEAGGRDHCRMSARGARQTIAKLLFYLEKATTCCKESLAIATF